MDSKRIDLAGSRVLLCGLGFTSRTETVEDYFKTRVKELCVIALSSCFLKENLSSLRVYRDGALVRQEKLFNFRIKDYAWYRQPLVLMVFIVNWFSVLAAVMRLKGKFDLYVGISHSFALFGAILKKLGRVRKLLYYCIDYYMPGPTPTFNNLFIRGINAIDQFTVRTSDYVWDLSEKIPVQRASLGRIGVGTYLSALVPLGYARYVRRKKPLTLQNRWTIGFVGSVSSNQGLQLLAQSMPAVLKVLPQAHVRIIGQGPFLDELKSIVKREGVESAFTFTGFVREESAMLDMLADSAVGVALYSTQGCGNVECADTGKPKLYAVCGLPIVATTCTFLKDIVANRAGAQVAYDATELAAVLIDLLGDEAKLREYRENSWKLGEKFMSDVIFDEALQRTLLT